MAGRDIGSVVLPDADLKLYLDASVEERARRRTAQWGHPPDGAEAAEILAELRRRDRIDSTRPVAPLRIPDDALIINTDGNTFDETVAMVEGAIRDAETDAVRDEADDDRRSRPADAARGPPAVEPAAVGNASLFIRLTDWFGRTMVRCLTRVRVDGLDNARGLTGPLIVAANHVSNADGVLVASWITPVIGRRIYLLGKQEALDWPLIGLGLRHNGVLGIRRGAADLEAFRAAKHILDEGHVLGIFPEGTRSPTGALQEAKDGLAILALRTGATILPVGVAEHGPLLAARQTAPVRRLGGPARRPAVQARRGDQGPATARRPGCCDRPRSWAGSPACCRRASAAPTPIGSARTSSGLDRPRSRTARTGAERAA